MNTWRYDRFGDEVDTLCGLVLAALEKAEDMIHLEDGEHGENGYVSDLGTVPVEQLRAILLELERGKPNLIRG